MDRTKRILPLLCCLLWAAATRAQQPVLHARDNLHATAGTIDRIGPAESSPVTAADSTRCDGAATSRNTADTTSAAVKRPGLIRRIIDYYSRSNVDRTFEKRIDWSIAPGPSYASDTGLGLGFLVAGLYRRDRTDTVTAPSDISIYGYVTTKKYITLRFSGQNIFNGNKQKLNYSGAFVHYPGDFYGVGWTDGANGYKQALTTTIGTMNIDYGMSVWRELFLGVSGGIDYSGAKYASSGMVGRLDAIADEVAAGGAVPGGTLGQLYELWTEGRYAPALQDPFSNYIESTGEKPDALNTHIGIFAQYDTRDVSFNAFRGVFVKLEAKWYPRVLGNTGRDFGRITCTFDWYRRLWRGAVLAYDLYGDFLLGTPSWHMFAKLGGSDRMRGYYEGRYRDKRLVETQLELRQRIYRRHGIVAWGGLGNIWGRSPFRWRNTLYNFGAGYRFEFKKRMNIRFDYGWGRFGNRNLPWDDKRSSAFFFTISEAF